MKKIYLLFLLAISFSFNQINAESCPDSAIIASSGGNLILSYAPGTSLCGDRPGTVTVDVSTVFTLSGCFGDISVYDYTSGPILSDSGTLTIVSGFDTTCNYADSLLPTEEYEFLNATFKVYPNPLTKDSQLTVKFATNITAKIYMYDVTGKLAVTDEIDNVNSKRINISTLTNGVYFLRLVTDKVTITKKVIIMK